MNAAISKEILSIRGSATRPNFAYYKFELRREEDKAWAFIRSFNRPVTNDILMNWDTQPLRPGVYWLRLIVVDSRGNFWPEFAQLRFSISN